MKSEIISMQKIGNGSFNHLPWRIDFEKQFKMKNNVWYTNPSIVSRERSLLLYCESGSS